MNTLYVALGMVHWYESDGSEQPRKAPLILVPVRIDRSDINAEFRIEYDDEDVGANLSFTEKMKYDFGIDIPNLHEVSDEDDDEIDVERYFESVSRPVAHMPRWSVDKLSVVLGMFSFQKLLMYHDLSGDQWSPNGGMDGNPIIRALFQDGFSDPGHTVGAVEQLDECLSPIDLHHVVDADSSQTVVIADVARGRDLVVQGPPGTGKSQTIVNLIADGISQRKTVLFVSEKMAALEVVKRRLDEIHLGDACLELHSHKTTKRAVLDELRRTMQLGQPQTEGIQENLDSLTRVRDRLNDYAIAVNHPIGKTETTPHQAMGELCRITSEGESIEHPAVDIAGIEAWSKADFGRKREVIEQLRLRVRGIGVPSEHIFWGVRIGAPLLPQKRRELKQAIGQAVDSLHSLKSYSERLSEALRRPAPESPRDTTSLILAGQLLIQAPDYSGLNLESAVWDTQPNDLMSLVAAGERLQDLRSEYASILLPEAWNADLRETKRVLSTTGRKLWRFLSGEYRRHRDQLAASFTGDPARDVARMLEVVDAVMEAQRLDASIRGSLASVSEALGSLWKGPLSDWQDIALKVRWHLDLIDDIQRGVAPAAVRDSIRELEWRESRSALQSLVSEAQTASEKHRSTIVDLQDALEIDTMTRFGTSEGLPSLSFAEQLKILKSWSERSTDIDGIISFNAGAEQVRLEGLDGLVGLAERWPGAVESLTSVLNVAWYESIIGRAYEERSALQDFNLGVHVDTIQQFAERDRQSIIHNRSRVADMHWRGLPPYNAGGDVGVLTREFEKKKKHLPIRQLILRAGHAIQAIKPVFMMSPLSIASYIPPGAVEFDIVVFDEASQVKPVEALGALLRGTQAVVVGDTEQLPPTTFFDNLVGEDDDDEASVTTDMESILGLFRAKGAPVETLRWHYRSRHESLITLSNHEFYDDKLVVFASPDFERAETGLRYHHLPDTIYEGGVNRGEARVVAEAIMNHARCSPGLTLGVAAFGIKQSDAIQDELEILRRNDPSLESFFAAHLHEPFFVKNLENVQGDERDVVFISVGYGRNAIGQVSMNFGPLNKDGGHRRLNVLITRARRQCHVFTNLRSDDIALNRTNARGVRVFKTFLLYGETGEMPHDLPTGSGRDSGSPFQSLVASSIRQRGYTVHEEVASGGKFIDIAVVDPERPGRYVLGIEFDGASYHSARWARDRDRLRDQVLEDLGWRLHRIWSTDYFSNPEREIDRAVTAIEQAIASHTAEPVVAVPQSHAIQRAHSQHETDERPMPPYRVAEPVVWLGWLDLHEVSPYSLIDPITEVVHVESPVHVNEVAHRLAAAVGVRRVGSRIQQTIELAVGLCVRGNRVARSRDFLWDVTMDMARPPIRDRSELPTQSRKIELVAPEEIGEAIRAVVERSVRITHDEAVVQVASLLGFRRTSSGIREAISEVLSEMLKAGVLAGDGINVRLR